MSRRAVLSLFPLALLVAACGTQVSDGSGNEAAHLRRVGEAIVNGTPSPVTDNAVVYIAVNGNSGDFCTGTLIAPNLVITARHCVSALDETVECGAFTTQSAPSTLGISIGQTPGAVTAKATKIFVDTVKGTSSCGNDIALFQLDQDLPNAMIAKVRFTKLSVGEVARTAGYGDSGSGTPTSSRFEKTGIKVDSVGPASYTYTDRAGKTYPVSLPAGEIVTGESTCFGDSGGPLFDGAGNVIGMTSRGIDDKCIDRPSIYSDTASHAQFIKDAAVAAGHPLADAETPSTPSAPSTTTPSGSRGTTTGASDPSSSDDGSLGDDGTTKKKARTSLSPTSGGCSAAPGNASAPASSSLVLAALALGVVLARRRRRASHDETREFWLSPREARFAAGESGEARERSERGGRSPR